VGLEIAYLKARPGRKRKVLTQKKRKKEKAATFIREEKGVSADTHGNGGGKSILSTLG